MMRKLDKQTGFKQFSRPFGVGKSGSYLQRIMILFWLIVYCHSQSLTPIYWVQQKFCGKALTDAIDLVCVHGFNTLPPVGVAAIVDDDDNVAAMQNEYASMANMRFDAAKSPAFLWLKKRQVLNNPLLANMLLRSRPRRQPEDGVIDECCRKACSYSELATYCRRPN